MSKQPDWYAYQTEKQWALAWFEWAEVAMAKGHYSAARLYMTKMYVALMDAADTVWRPETTEKQKRQQRLWQERGLLERTQANLRSVIEPLPIGSDLRIDLVEALFAVQSLIILNQAAMRNLK